MADWIHLDILRMSIRGRRMNTVEVDRAEMHQLPLPLTVRIRRSFQRHREPHGQYRIDAGNEVSLATGSKGTDGVNVQSICASSE